MCCFFGVIINNDTSLLLCGVNIFTVPNTPEYMKVESMMSRSILSYVKQLLAFAVALFSMALLAKDPLTVVTEPWPPFTIMEGENISGADIEIIEAVFARLEMPITIVNCPWKRCLKLVKDLKADAILDASMTEERKDFLFFPKEAVSEGITTFFISEGRNIPFTGLNSLNGLKAGAISGYKYCDEIDNSQFTIEAERVASVTQNFKKLLLGRIDFLIAVDAVGYYTAQQMNILDKISIIQNANFCYDGNFLAFSKKEGHKQLSKQFGQVLERFKTTQKYRQILTKYGKNFKWSAM